MDFEWIAVGVNEVVWVGVAFVLGFLARAVGLPPLAGFLAAGFVLSEQGSANADLLQKLADLGITLLLFTVGLKLNLKTLIRPQVWAVTGLHVALLVGVLGLLLYGLGFLGAVMLAELDFATAFLVAFALSFSSTVFVVKALEERGEMTSLHGRIAIGILIMQDIAAVIFMVVSTGKLPTAWAVLLLLVIPLRPVFVKLLERAGHGELLVLYGFLLALGGAELFELVQLKGDLGALIFGVMMANHPKAEELAKTMLGFKDLFLLGFFLSVGASGQLNQEALLLGVMLTPLLFVKSAGFFLLMTQFSLRARTALVATLDLSNFSEFGLIVLAVGVANGWIDGQWLIALSVALALSFVLAAALNSNAHELYRRYRSFWDRWQKPVRLPDDSPLDIAGAEIVIIGMGGIGSGAYDNLRDTYGDALVGIDIDPVTVANHQAAGRNVLLGDPTDMDFWDRVQATHELQMVMLAMPKVASNLEVLERLADAEFSGQIAATAKFADEEALLKQAGAQIVFNVYDESGAGFANRVSG